MSEAIETTAEAMVAPGKGILAADESSGTIKKRFAAIGAESSEDARRDYRELLFRSVDAMQNCISGVILFDETIRQKAKDGTPLVEIITQSGSIPGIKVDEGAKPLAHWEGDTITEGLDGLRERFAEYRDLGARFAKWRAVLRIGADQPSPAAIEANAHALARYAALAQEAGLVPIVEPEVLMDGSHDIDRCYVVTEGVLHTVFGQLYEQGVLLEGMILKPNMVISGTECSEQAGVEEVAERTVTCLKRTVPAAVPGICFLSGGQSEVDATAHLNAMNAMFDAPWPLSFSYGRALQASALEAWKGERSNVAAAQAAFTHRARMNSLAATGEWRPEKEKAA